MQLGIFFVFISTIACSFLTVVLVTVLKAKPLGFQTLYDVTLINTTECHCFYVWLFFLVTILPMFFPNGLGHIFGPIVFILFFSSVINLAITLGSVPSIRYILIYHSTLLSGQDDSTFVRNLRIFTLSMGFIAVVTQYVLTGFQGDHNFARLAYGYETQLEFEATGMNPLAKYAFLISMIPFIILQVRLEISNLQHNEGTMIKIMAWMKKTKERMMKNEDSTANDDQESRVDAENTEPESEEANHIGSYFSEIRFQRVFITLIFLMLSVIFLNFSVTLSVIDVQQLTVIFVINFMYFLFIIDNSQVRSFVATEFHFLIE